MHCPSFAIVFIAALIAIQCTSAAPTDSMVKQKRGESSPDHAVGLLLTGTLYGVGGVAKHTLNPKSNGSKEETAEAASIAGGNIGDGLGSFLGRN
jgi:hypothetical protein